MNRRTWFVFGFLFLGGAVVLTILTPVSTQHATISAHPVDGDKVSPPLNLSDLGPQCQRVARHAIAGQTVFEEGYLLGTTEPYRTRTHSTVVMAVKRTNLSGGWQLGEVICIGRIGSWPLRAEGQVYQTTLGNHRKRDLNWTNGLPYPVALAALFFVTRGMAS